MNVLFISNLFPNCREPARGMFNAQQVAALAKACTITKVIAPTPQPVPDETRDGLIVEHPRFRHIPLLSRPYNGWLFARSIEEELLAPSLSQRGSMSAVPSVVTGSQFAFDIVLVNWAYPDAYGVMLLARKYGFPFASTVQGSDVNVLFRNPVRKRQVLQALRASAAVFCRSEALRAKLVIEGIDATTVYNGVDRQRFRPLPHAEACAQLGLDPARRRILYVGNLQSVKGPTVLAEAFVSLMADKDRDHRSEVKGQLDLVMIGQGPEEVAIRRILADLTPDRCPLTSVSLVGAKPHHEIPLWMNACDVLCLPSFNEGLPNVCIEAAACGLPVVASNTGGVPEVVQEGINGFWVPPGDPGALAEALTRALSYPWDRTAIVQSVAPFDWDANARKVVAVLHSALSTSSSTSV